MVAKGKVSRRYLSGHGGKPTKVLIGGKAASRGARKPDTVPFASIRICELEMVFRHRYGKEQLPDDDAGRADAELVLHHVAHRGVTDPMLLMNQWLDHWAPWLTGDERAAMIAHVMKNPLTFLADTTAHRIGNFTDAERTLLGVTTIGSVDVDVEQRKARQKMKNTARHAERRRQGGAVPRAQWLAANGASRTKPWLALGISRASFYREVKKAARLAKSPYAADGPVSRISHAVVGITVM